MPIKFTSLSKLILSVVTTVVVTSLCPPGITSVNGRDLNDQTNAKTNLATAQNNQTQKINEQAAELVVKKINAIVAGTRLERQDKHVQLLAIETKISNYIKQQLTIDNELKKLLVTRQQTIDKMNSNQQQLDKIKQDITDLAAKITINRQNQTTTQQKVLLNQRKLALALAKAQRFSIDRPIAGFSQIATAVNDNRARSVTARIFTFLYTRQIQMRQSLTAIKTQYIANNQSHTILQRNSDTLTNAQINLNQLLNAKNRLISNKKLKLAKHQADVDKLSQQAKALKLKIQAINDEMIKAIEQPLANLNSAAIVTTLKQTNIYDQTNNSDQQLHRYIDKLKRQKTSGEDDADNNSPVTNNDNNAPDGDTKPQIASFNNGAILIDNKIFADQTRNEPAISFTRAKGLLPIPVAGIKLSTFGQQNALGTIAKGMSISSIPGSKVIAPCDGWIIYAGQFRSYGNVIIINAGQNYQLLLAGLGKITAKVGEFIKIGEIIGSMPDKRMATAAMMPNILAGKTYTQDKSDTLPYRYNNPVIYIELRKNGVAINSSPWWAKKVTENDQNTSLKGINNEN